MTEATAKVHVRHIMRKFGAANRTQAALCAERLGALIPGVHFGGNPENDIHAGPQAPKPKVVR